MPWLFSRKPVEPLLSKAQLLPSVPLEQAQGRIEELTAKLAEKEWLESAIRESEERYRKSFEASGIGMAIVSSDGKLAHANQALCVITGYDSEELCKKTLQDITHPDDFDQGHAFIREILVGKLPYFHTERRYVQKSGQEVWVFLNVSLVRDPSGAPQFFLFQVQDISERKKIEHELQGKVKALERFQKLVVGRELRMRALKKRVAELESSAAASEAGPDGH